MSTNFNNDVRDGHGRLVGFRCFECGGVFDRMWGNTCNGCSEKERRHQELLAQLNRACHSGACDFVSHPCGLRICPRRADSAGEKP